MKLWAVITLFVVGLFLAIGGIVLQKVFPSIMESSLEKKLILAEDSPTIGNFIDPPVPIFMQFYFFNVTNPDEILAGEKAVLNEIGPFTYEEKRLKYDLEWDDEDHTVIYRQNKTFFFRRDLSVHDEDFNITTLNAVYISLGKKTSAASYFDLVASSIMSIIDYSYDLQVFITKPAGQLLFEGYEEQLLNDISVITGDPLHALGRFGFFFPKNGTNDGSYKVFTGAEGLDTLQVIEEWREEPYLDYWKTEECNMINGTEGSQFPQPIEEGGRVWMYSADLCRSLYLKYEKTVMHGDLALYRFILPPEALEKNPSTECYCDDDFTCRSSLVNLAPCKKGSPVIASTPHYYLGTNETINGVDGLSPNKMEHETYVDVEPNTGVTFRAAKRIQISMPLRRYSKIEDLDNVQEVIFPILWLNESAVVPVERANVLYSKLNTPAVIVFYTSWVLVGVGLIMVLVAVASSFRICKPKPSDPTTFKNVKSQPISMVETVDYQKSENYKHLFS